MRLNEHTALLSTRVALVPYCAHHVPLYHEWMQDPELQEATASEPLSLEAEYEMQHSWRSDHDKLTFIICRPLEYPDESKIVHAPDIDSDDKMIGDINLFLSTDDDDDENEPASTLIGEIELMIASKQSRRKGYGKNALLSFLSYIARSLIDILAEYRSGGPDASNQQLAYLRVKISERNAASLALFESIGFQRSSEHANYFGELELRLSLEQLATIASRSEAFKEVRYALPTS